MLNDARRVPAGTTLSADVCIIGAGAAGITLACELAAGSQKVLLLESGGFDFEDATQALYQGEIVGHPLNPPDVSRLRYFGGTTNHWGGMCAPLAAEDFRVRPWVQYSGWPIGAEDLAGYWRRAVPYVQITSDNFSAADWADELPAIFRGNTLGERLAPLLFQQSPPTRFGEVFRERLTAAKPIETLLHANVLSLMADADARTVERVAVGCLDGNRFFVRARVFILATGAIENARLLLLSDGVQTAGLGNGNDLVGRFFMGHPQFDDGARIVLEAPTAAAAKPLGSTLHTYAMLRLTAATAAREQLPGFAAHLDPRASEVAPTLHQTPSYLALKRLVARFKGTQFPTTTAGDDLRTVLADLDGLASGLYTRFGKAPILDVRPQCEQVPNPASRVYLGSERDALGLRRIVVDWRLTDLDVLGMRRGLAIVGETFTGTGLGRLELSEAMREATPATLACAEAWHHIGTTRMSEDPRSGVVDRDCRVHGTTNLFVAGSSVFPTTGIVNPTFTIVALAIRMADHLRERMA
jgi:choline dehydrogenase-like flavoprotein